MTKVVGQKVCLQLIKSATKYTIHGLHGLGIKVHTRLLVQQEHV